MILKKFAKQNSEKFPQMFQTHYTKQCFVQNLVFYVKRIKSEMLGGTMCKNRKLANPDKLSGERGHAKKSLQRRKKMLFCLTKFARLLKFSCHRFFSGAAPPQITGGSISLRVFSLTPSSSSCTCPSVGE